MIGYSFSFDKDIVNLDSIGRVLENIIPFSPYSMRLGGKQHLFELKKCIECIISGQAVSIYDSKKVEQIHFIGFGASNCFELTFELYDQKISEKQSQSILGLKGFTMGYIYDAEFVKWQMASSIQYYEMCKRDHSQLKKIMGPTGHFMVIDTSNNFGRKEFFFKCRLMVAPIMYISISMSEFFPVSKLIKYSDAETKIILEGNVIKLELFPEPLNSEENYYELQKLWIYLNYNQLIARFKNSFG